MRTPEEQLVDASLDMGKALLLAGGEVTRVEDTITRILHAYGMHKVGVFTITSLIEVTARTPDGDEIVKARRIAGGYATNLDRVEQLNALSREICATCPPPQDIISRIEAIKYPKPEAAWISYIGAMLAAGSFTVFFGGRLADVPATIILACFINWMDRKGIYKKENQLLFYLVCSIVTGFLGCILVRVGIGVHLDKILIGCIMLTIPGIPITYAMRDMLLGESITGSVPVCGIPAHCGQHCGRLPACDRPCRGGAVMGQILAGALGGLGFSIVFGVRKKYMVLIALNAGLSWAVYLAVNALAGDFAGNMASAMFCSLMAAVLARRIKVPTVVLQMPATVPMIPGGSLYYTMLYVFSGDMINAKLYFLSTIRAIFGMAIGFAVVSVLLRTLAEKRTRATHGA